MNIITMITEAIRYRRKAKAYAEEVDIWNRKVRMYQRWGVFR